MMKNISLILGFLAIATVNVGAMDDKVYTESLRCGTKIENVKSYSKIVVPHDTRAISTFCFVKSNIKEIDFSNCKSLIAIGKMAFQECTQIESLNIPGTIQEIREEAFRDIDIRQLIIGENAIPQGFKKTFDSTALKIRDLAFCSCNLLEVLDIRKDVSYIGAEAFKSHNVKNIELNGVEFIGIDAFLGGQSLQSIKLNNCNNLEIHAGAFACSEHLTKVEISGNIKMISPDAFHLGGKDEYAKIENFTIYSTENDDIHNQLIAAGIKPEAIHFVQ